jgi:putative transcriptional regulator
MTKQEIKEIRNDLQISAVEMAERCGVAVNTLYKWECGNRTPGGPALMILRQLQRQAKRKASKLQLQPA